MNRFLFSFILAILTASQPAAAQPDARTLADGEILRGRFVQERHLQGFSAPIRSGGTFAVVAGNGLIWRVETPFRVTTVVTRRGVAQATESAETLRLSAARVPAVTRLYEALAGALAGDWNRLEAEFAVTRKREGNDDLLTAIPKAGMELVAIASINVRFRAFVERIEIARPSGDMDIITFTDQGRETAAPRPDEAALLATVVQ